MNEPRQISASRNSGPEPGAVRPFGRYGVGVLTEHPAGLLVVAAVILLFLETIPAAGWFLAGSLALGGIFGLILWLLHRS